MLSEHHGQTMNPVKVIEQRCPDPAVWEPLLKVLPEKAVTHFMFMGEVLWDHSTRIYLYKHIWTRRYINLDAQGRAYQFHASAQGSHYVPVELTAAIRRTELGRNAPVSRSWSRKGVVGPLARTCRALMQKKSSTSSPWRSDQD